MYTLWIGTAEMVHVLVWHFSNISREKKHQIENSRIFLSVGQYFISKPSSFLPVEIKCVSTHLNRSNYESPCRMNNKLHCLSVYSILVGIISKTV